MDEPGVVNRELRVFIDEYIRLMDAIEYRGDVPKGEDAAFIQLLQRKEQDILFMLSSDID